MSAVATVRELRISSTSNLSLGALPQVLDDTKVHGDEFEMRGVSIALFIAIRDNLLKVNSDESFWTVGRVNATYLGNHEILRENNRWRQEGLPDLEAIITYSEKCSLIELLKRKYFNSKHETLGVSYQEVVSEQANVFVSFAYSNNFIELVDALACFLIAHSVEFPQESTFFWFDSFVNDQWTALEKDFVWWSTTFRSAVQKIGTTVCILSPWHAPVLLTRAWCLYEISCSKRLFIALSSKQEEGFKLILRSDQDMIISALCRIMLENATSYLPEDKLLIFNVVEKMDGGFARFNNLVVGMVRAWINGRLHQIIDSLDATGIIDNHHGQSAVTDSAEALENITHVAVEYHEQGNCNEALALYERALKGYEATIGPNHGKTLLIVNNLAILLRTLARYDEAVQLHERAISGYEVLFGQEHPATLRSMSSMATTLSDIGKREESLLLYQRVLISKEKVHGAEHVDTLRTVTCIAAILHSKGQFSEALQLYQRVLTGNKQVLGDNHPATLDIMNNIAAINCAQGNLDEALAVYRDVLVAYERSLGPDHPGTLRVMNNMGIALKTQQRYDDALLMYQRALSGYERALGSEHPSTLEVAFNMANVMSLLGRHDEAVEFHARCLGDKYSSSLIELNLVIDKYPKSLLHGAHAHELQLERQVYNGSYSCDICNGAGLQWVYHCEACGFDAHPQCVYTIST